MTQKVKTEVDVRMYYQRPSVIRTWLLVLNLFAGNGIPLVATASDIARVSGSNGARPLSRTTIGKAIKTLEKIGALSVRRQGHAMVLTSDVELPNG